MAQLARKVLRMLTKLAGHFGLAKPHQLNCNTTSQPFKWTKSAEAILASVDRARKALGYAT